MSQPRTQEELRQKYFEETNEEWSRGGGIPSTTYFQWLESKAIENISPSYIEAIGLKSIGMVSELDHIERLKSELKEGFADRGIVIVDSRLEKERCDFRNGIDNINLIKNFESELTPNSINWEEFHPEEKTTAVYHPKRKKFKRK